MLKSMNKNKIVIVAVIVLVILGAAFGAYKANKDKGYSIVYLVTGEVYIGKLTTFPDLELRNSYILLIAKDPEDANKNTFQLNPIKDALWAPKAIHLVKDNVVFYGSLDPESQIAKTLAEQGK